MKEQFLPAPSEALSYLSHEEVASQKGEGLAQGHITCKEGPRVSPGHWAQYLLLSSVDTWSTLHCRAGRERLSNTN